MWAAYHNEENPLFRKLGLDRSGPNFVLELVILVSDVDRGFNLTRNPSTFGIL